MLVAARAASRILPPPFFQSPGGSSAHRRMNATISRSLPAWGARPTVNGVHFSLWAPAMESIDVFIEGDIEPLRLQRGDDGWHSLITRRAQAGSRYRYI